MHNNKGHAAQALAQEVSKDIGSPVYSVIANY